VYCFLGCIPHPPRSAAGCARCQPWPFTALGIKRNVVFVLAIAENAIDSLSYKPHAIIRSHKGFTVEIGNTDAEGRYVGGEEGRTPRARP